MSLKVRVGSLAVKVSCTLLCFGKTGLPKMREYPLRPPPTDAESQGENPWEIEPGSGHGGTSRIDAMVVVNGLGEEEGYAPQERVLVTVGDGGGLLQWRIGAAGR